MSALIEKHAVKITIGAFLALLITIGTAVWQTAIAYSSLSSHESRISKLEEMMKNVATKDDIQTLKQDIKDYINK